MNKKTVINAKNISVGQGNINNGTVCIGDGNYNNVVVVRKKKTTKIEKAKVFIVHGYDNESKLEVALFIETIGI